jgi:hypothetical protein
MTFTKNFRQYTDKVKKYKYIGQVKSLWKQSLFIFSLEKTLFNDSGWKRELNNIRKRLRLGKKV